MKFGTPDENGDNVPFTYDDVFEESEPSLQRVVIAPKTNHVSLLFELTRCWHMQSFALIYELLVGRTGRNEGRYESPQIDADELREFLRKFGPFLEQDGRHNLFITTPSEEGMLVYDQHEIIYAYGPVPAYREILRRRAFVEQKFFIPNPHAHGYHAEFDRVEDQLFEFCAWTFVQGARP